MATVSVTDFSAGTTYAQAPATLAFRWHKSGVTLAAETPQALIELKLDHEELYKLRHLLDPDSTQTHLPLDFMPGKG